MAAAQQLPQTARRMSKTSKLTLVALVFSVSTRITPWLQQAAGHMLRRGASGGRRSLLDAGHVVGASSIRGFQRCWCSLRGALPLRAPLGLGPVPQLRREVLSVRTMGPDSATGIFMPLQYLWQVDPEYDWDKPSSENYQASEPVNNSGLFADIRNRLDADYHGYYTERRQRLQDELLQDVLATGLPDERPWIVYTAGAMGAGKSHVVRWLSRNDYFALPIFVQIDLDRFRTQLPEWLGYVARNSASAGALTHREAGYCAEIAQEAALQRCKHVWVDGSLHDAEWYASEFRRIRKEHPQYRIAIYHVVANWTTVQARVATRATHTGRVVPQDALQKSYHEVPQAVRQLRPFVDFYARIENQEALPRLADLCVKNAQSATGMAGEIERPPCSWEVIRAEFAPLHGASQEGALRSWLERLIAEESVLIFAHSQGSGSCQLFLTEVLGIPGVRVLELDQMSSWPFEEDTWEDKGSGRMSTTQEGFGFVVLHELSKMTGMDTVPQIFVGGTFLGGCEELQRLQQSGRLIQQIETAVQAAKKRRSCAWGLVFRVS